VLLLYGAGFAGPFFGLGGKLARKWFAVEDSSPRTKYCCKVLQFSESEYTNIFFVENMKKALVV